MPEYEYVPDEDLRFKNGLTIADVARLEMNRQGRINSGEDVWVDGCGYVPRKLLVEPPHIDWASLWKWDDK